MKKVTIILLGTLLICNFILLFIVNQLFNTINFIKQQINKPPIYHIIIHPRINKNSKIIPYDTIYFEK